MDFKKKLIDISGEHSILIHAKNDTRVATIEASSGSSLPISQNDSVIASALQTAVDDPNYMKVLKADAKRRKNLSAMKTIIKKKKRTALFEIDDDDVEITTPQRAIGNHHFPAQVTPASGAAGGSRFITDLDDLVRRGVETPLPPFNTGFPSSRNMEE